jgi:non-heme chloroperoxidase
MFIETNDSTCLAVDLWGAGRPIVLVHAWGLNSHMWNAQLPALLDAGLQVVTVDQRGHGRSDRPATGYQLDTMSADLVRVLDALDLHDVVLVGQSMGGAVVAHAAGGLGSSRITKIVLSAPITPA